MRILSVVGFVLRAMFGSIWGLVGMLLALLKLLWQILQGWQAVDFLPGRMMPLADFLNSIWGTLVLLVLGFLFMGKAVYNRWPETQESEPQGVARTSTSQPTPETQRPPVPQPPQAVTDQSDYEELKQRSLELSKELLRFATERDSKDPNRTIWPPFADIFDDDPEGKKRLSEHSQKGMAHFYETMDLYDQRFAGPVMALFDALEGRKWVKPKEREKFQPGSPPEIRDVARRLGAIGNRLDKSMDRSDDEGLQGENEQAEVGTQLPKKTLVRGEGGSRGEDLKRRCREFADEIRQFLEDHKSKGSNEEEIMRPYRRHLGDKASALLEELEEQGLYPPKHLKSFELDANAYPRSPMAINRLANTLGTIGHRK